MSISRTVTALCALFLGVGLPGISTAESSGGDEILNNKIVITVADAGVYQTDFTSFLTQVRNSVLDNGSQYGITGVTSLFPEFCELSGANGTSSTVAHLKLLEDGISSLPNLSVERIKAIQAYLSKPATELCNQFVVTAKDNSSESLRDVMTNMNLSKGLQITELQPVHKYRINKELLTSLASSKVRPDSLISVITSVKLNSIFAGMRWANKKEIPADNIDNDQNAYTDDIGGIYSSDYEPEFSSVDQTGFVTLALGKDRGAAIEYSTVDAAQAYLYTLHRCPDQVLIPHALSDRVIEKLVKIATQLGIRSMPGSRLPKVVPESGKVAPTTAIPLKAKEEPKSVKPPRAVSPDKAGEPIFAELIGDKTRACSSYLTKANTIQTFLSMVDGSRMLGKAAWNRETINARLTALQNLISLAALDLSKDGKKKLKKLKNEKKAFVLARRQLAQCSASANDSQRRTTPIAFDDIKPILDKKCMVCHSIQGGAAPQWTAPLTPESLLSSHRVTAQQRSLSSIYTSLRGNQEGFQPANMPLGGAALSKPQIMLIGQWIDGLAIAPTPPDDPGSNDPVKQIKKGQQLYTDNCMGCHGALETSAKFGRTADEIQAALDPNTGTPSMRALGRVLTREQIELIALALNTKPGSTADSWSLNIGTSTYVASVFKAIFLPDDVSTFIAQDTTILNKITADVLAANKARFFGGMCDNKESSCLSELSGSGTTMKPPPSVIRSGLIAKLVDDILSSTNPRALTTALSKINRTTTSPIDGQAVKDAYSLIYPGHTIPDTEAESIATIVKGVPGYTQIDYWRFLIKFLCTTGHWEIF